MSLILSKLHEKLTENQKMDEKIHCMSDFIPGIPIEIANFRSKFSNFDRHIGLPIGKTEFQSEIKFSDGPNFF